MTPENYEANLTVVRYMYAKSLASLFFNRWVVTIVSSLSLILLVQDLINYRDTEVIPTTDNLIVLGASLLALLYTLRRIRAVHIINAMSMHDLAQLTSYLHLRNIQINDKVDSVDALVDKVGEMLDKDIRKRYDIKSK